MNKNGFFLPTGRLFGNNDLLRYDVFLQGIWHSDSILEDFPGEVFCWILHYPWSRNGGREPPLD